MCEHGGGVSGSVKCGGYFSVSEGLSAFQQGNCFMDLVRASLNTQELFG